MTSEFFSVEHLDGALVVSFVGPAGSFAEETSRSQWKSIFSAIEQPDVRGVVIDLQNCDYFGSTMIDFLIKAGNQAAAHNRSQVICNLSPAGREILEVVRVASFWPVFADREAALKSFPPA